MTPQTDSRRPRPLRMASVWVVKDPGCHGEVLSIHASAASARAWWGEDLVVENWALYDLGIGRDD